ncbi:flavin reductase family protein [bacterium]|nr:flavin reductase family protein [bacterium]
MNNEVLKNLSYGVYVVTSNCGETPTGCVANSLIQVTYNTVLVSMHHDNYTNKCIEESQKFAVSILGIDIDNKVIGTFGYRSARDVDKFKDINTKIVNGLHIIEDAIGYLVCDVVDKMETETHTLFLGKIIDCEMLHDEIPMTYAYFHKERKGKSPKNAPTFSN